MQWCPRISESQKYSQVTLKKYKITKKYEKKNIFLNISSKVLISDVLFITKREEYFVLYGKQLIAFQTR